MNAPITGLYAALLAIIIVWLIVPVIRNRQGLKVGLGDGGKSAMLQVIRAHGNAVEFIPIFLLLLFLFEVNGGSSSSNGAKIFLHAMGATFVIARILHPLGMYKSAGASFGRVAGALLSIAAILVMALANILRYFGVV
jgi:uncharacterized protein